MIHYLLTSPLCFSILHLFIVQAAVISMNVEEKFFPLLVKNEIATFYNSVCSKIIFMSDSIQKSLFDASSLCYMTNVLKTRPCSEDVRKSEISKEAILNLYQSLFLRAFLSPTWISQPYNKTPETKHIHIKLLTPIL